MCEGRQNALINLLHAMHTFKKYDATLFGLYHFWTRLCLCWRSKARKWSAGDAKLTLRAEWHVPHTAVNHSSFRWRMPLPALQGLNCQEKPLHGRQQLGDGFWLQWSLRNERSGKSHLFGRNDKSLQPPWKGAKCKACSSEANRFNAKEKEVPDVTKNEAYLISFFHITNFLSRRRVNDWEFFATGWIMPFIVYKYLQGNRRQTEKSTLCHRFFPLSSFWLQECAFLQRKVILRLWSGLMKCCNCKLFRQRVPKSGLYAYSSMPWGKNA